MKQRIITAIILLLTLLFFLWLGGVPYIIFIIIVLSIAGFEWSQLFLAGGFSPSSVLTITGIVSSIAFSLLLPTVDKRIFYIGFLAVSFTLEFFHQKTTHNNLLMNLLAQSCGVLYLSEFGLSFIQLRLLSHGIYWLLFFVAITATGDSIALFIGKRWGKHKLLENISPNKSWEGLGAGVLAAGITGVGFALFRPYPNQTSSLWGFVIAAGVYLVCIIGDLFISLIKRWAGEKDTSGLLPGHGGFLDRIDSHLWSATLGFQLIVLLGFSA